MAKRTALHKQSGSRKYRQTRSIIESSPEPYIAQSMGETEVRSNTSRKPNITVGILLVGLILVGLFVVRRGYIVSAIVNGRPIFSWQLMSVLQHRYGTQTLDGMITERLISDAVTKAHITLSQTDVDAREKEIVNSLGGGVRLEDLLTYQGISKEDFDSQVKTQLSVERLLGKDIQFSGGDIDNFLSTSSGLLTATEPAALRDEAQKFLTQQEIGKRIQPWFTQLKQSAKIIKFP